MYTLILCSLHPDGARLNYTNFMLADIQRIKAKLKSANRSSKPSKPFMKPTASHLAKHINAVDINTDSCGRCLCYLNSVLLLI